MPTDNYCAAYPVGQDWVLSVDPEAFVFEDESTNQGEKATIAIHFVIDNSLSMGSMTNRVKNIFAEMVDSVATAPCSLTVFDTVGA